MLFGQDRKIYKERCLKIIKMLGLFKRKKHIEKLKEEVQDSFNHVKKDFNKVGEWIRHLDDKHGKHDGEIRRINDQLMSIHEDLIEIKDFVSFFGPQLSKQQFKQKQTTGLKQTTSVAVQTVDQTAVQTDVLESLTVMERAIVWSLINSEMKLSYEDLAALLGKDKSTIRGQINTIRQKREGIIEEMVEFNGKKRLYVPEEVKKKVVKGVKLKIRSPKKD